MKLWRPDRSSLEAGVAAVRADLDLETRDPKGATLQVGWANSPGRPSAPEWDPANAFRAYVSQWLVRRCIEIVADRVSSFPFRVGEDPDKPGDYDKKAPLAQLLGPPPGTPNPELDAGALWSWSIVNYLVTGRFAWEIERGRPRGDVQPGRPDSSGIVGLWPLVTGEVFPIPSDGGRSYFTGFEQRPGNGAKPVAFRRDQVAYLWKPSPTNPREPESTLAAAALNVNILYEIDGYSYGFMRNDATPATMIVHGRFDKPAQRDAWRNQVLGNHRGAENAGKAMFVEGDVDENGKIQGAIEVLKLGASARDSELTAIYEQQLTAVCGALGVPLSRLDASGRTFDNAGQEDTNWHEDKLLPLSRSLAAGVNRDLAPKFDDGKVGWFDLSKVRALRPQMATGVLFANVQADLTLDERRNFAGVDPADDETRKEIEDEKAAAAKAAQDVFAAQAAAKVPDATGANDGGKNAPNADTSANAKTGNGPGDVPAPRVATRAEDPEIRALSKADQESFEAESKRIKESKKTPIAQRAHDFEAAHWTHPNGHPRCKVCGQEEPVGGECEGIEDPDTALGHSAKRHAGAEGHDHVTSGHHEKGSLGDALVTARGSAVRRMTALLAAQLAELDERAVTSTRSRATGKRGQQLLRDGEVRADALYEPDFWAAATRTAVQPVFFAVASAAELALGLPAGEADLDAWASARAAAFAEARVAHQIGKLTVDLELGMPTTESMAEDAEELRGVGVSSQVVADAWDDAVRSLTPGVEVETLKTTLVKLAAGELDLNAALAELGTT